MNIINSIKHWYSFQYFAYFPLLQHFHYTIYFSIWQCNIALVYLQSSNMQMLLVALTLSAICVAYGVDWSCPNKAPSNEVNGCSVPFKLPAPFKKAFTPACNIHDVCYGCVSMRFGRYTLNKSSKWYIVYICRVSRKGLYADKFYPYFDFQCIIKIQNVVYVHFKSSCQYQFTDKTITSRAKWRLHPKYSRCRKCCASVKLLSEESFRWLQRCIQWIVLPELSQFYR